MRSIGNNLSLFSLYVRIDLLYSYFFFFCLLYIPTVQLASQQCIALIKEEKKFLCWENIRDETSAIGTAGNVLYKRTVLATPRRYSFGNSGPAMGSYNWRTSILILSMKAENQANGRYIQSRDTYGQTDRHAAFLPLLATKIKKSLFLPLDSRPS